jgi:hypothetical protein
MSRPVVAPATGGRYVVAYTDFNGDGDELGVALRAIDPGSPPTAAPAHANATTLFSQYDADLIATSSGLVVAWVDNANAATAPDLKFRTFGFDLTPTSEEQSLAATAANEGDVALAPWGSSWAAAWRAGEDGLETLRIQAGTTGWSIGPFLPGPVGSLPALAELDSTHLLVIYTEGTDVSDSGNIDGSKVRVAVLDVGQPGNVAGTDVPVGIACSVGLSQDQPNAVRAGDTVFLAWRTVAALLACGADANVGDPQAEELWLKEVRWNGTTLDLSVTELPLPRSSGHRKGDQRLPAFAVGPLMPLGQQLVTAFDDLGRNFPQGKGNADVIVEAIPIPLLRLP